MQDKPSRAEDLRGTTYSEDTELESAVLKEIFSLGHPITLEELIRHFGAFDTGETEFRSQDGIERAVRELVSGGLLHHTTDDFVRPTRAAHLFAELAEFP